MTKPRSTKQQKTAKSGTLSSQADSETTPNDSGRTKVPVDSKPPTVAEGPTGFPWRVKLSKGVSKTKLISFLVSKLFHSEKTAGLCFDEVVVLFHLFLDIEEKASKDKGFRATYAFQLNMLEAMLLEIESQEVFPIEVKWKELVTENELIRELPGLFIPWSTYCSQAGQKLWQRSFKVIYRYQEADQVFPPKRWMGIGHRDSGGRRDPGYDASPHWREVFKELCSFAELADEESDSLEI